MAECQELGKLVLRSSNFTIFNHKYNPCYNFVFPLGQNDFSTGNRGIEYLKRVGFEAEFTIPYGSGLLAYKMRKLDNAVDRVIC